MGRGLLDTLYTECDGFIEFRVKKPVKDAKMEAHNFFKPCDLDGIKRFITQHRGYDVWFGVSTRDGDKGKKENIVSIPAVWADLDWKTFPDEREGADRAIESFPLKPTIIVCSGGGYHCYWLLKEPYAKEDISEIEIVLRKLAGALNGDFNATDASRILRVPNTKNFKYTPPRPVTLQHCNGSEFALSDFDFLPEPPQIEHHHGTGVQSDNLDKIMACAFMQHCRENAKDLQEPAWYAMITQLMKEPGGIDLIHILSKPYKAYKKTETDRKILQAMNATGPHSCQTIREKIGFECGFTCGVISPAALAFKGVTDVTDVTNSRFCNRLHNGVTDVTDVISESNISERIRNWLETCDGIFTIRELAQEMQFNVLSNSYNTLKIILKRLVDNNTLCRVGAIRGTYRKRETDESIMDWWDEDASSEFDMALPLDLGSMCKLFPKNIVIIAGNKDSGKTTLSLNIARDNIGRQDIHYFTSEMSKPELRDRLSCFKNIDLRGWRAVNFHDVKEDFEDYILRYPNSLHIIDFLEIHEDFWKIGGTIRRIYDALKDGCAVINLQKKTEATFAKGGEVTIEKARLYLTLDRRFDQEIPYTRMLIKSAKIPREQETYPSGMVRDYLVDWSWKILPITDWYRPVEESSQPKKRYRERYKD